MKRQDAKDARAEFQEPEGDLDRLASIVISAAVEVHRHLGPGFLESVYEQSIGVESGLRCVAFESQVPVAVEYEGRPAGPGRLDLLVDGRLIVAREAVAGLDPIHTLPGHSYLRAFRRSLGLLTNFSVPVLLRGVRRVVFTS